MQLPTSHKTLICKLVNQILTITLNRPDRLNAFTLEMADELINVFEHANNDDSIRAIIVTGAGKAFCAGMELSREDNVFGLNEKLQPTLEDMDKKLENERIKSGVRDTGGQVVLAIYDCKKPIIAAINGPAVGIGATLTCAMDMRLIADDARVGFVFNKIGITPEACSSWFLPKIVNMGTALEWTFTGDLIDSSELEKKGFVRSVEKQGELLEKARELALRIARHSPVAVALTRQMMYRNVSKEHPLDAHKIDSLAIFYTSQTSGKEGVAAFLEKRAPNFQEKASSEMPPFYPWW